MCFFSPKKKKHRLTKKLRLQLVTVSLLACLLLEKKKHPKKEKHTASYGAHANMGTQLLPADPKVSLGDTFNGLVFNVAVDDLGFKKKMLILI